MFLTEENMNLKQRGTKEFGYSSHFVLIIFWIQSNCIFFFPVLLLLLWDRLIWNYPHKPRQSLSSQSSYCSNLPTAGMIGMSHRTQRAQLILFNVLLESCVRLLYQPGHRRGGHWGSSFGMDFKFSGGIGAVGTWRRQHAGLDYQIFFQKMSLFSERILEQRNLFCASKVVHRLRVTSVPFLTSLIYLS